MRLQSTKRVRLASCVAVQEAMVALPLYEAVEGFVKPDEVAGMRPGCACTAIDSVSAGKACEKGGP
jgi:hypothetical protein